MAFTNINIKVIHDEIIKPSSPTPNHLRSLPASLFDYVHVPTFTPLIFFFSKHNNSNNNNITPGELLDLLKRSLPDTLSVFYPLAGRIQNVGHFICNDEGVPYVHAVVDKSIEDVIHKLDASQLDKLLPQHGRIEHTAVLLAIQINSFACGGVAIGLKLNHVISNAVSLLRFVIAWASIANGKDPLTLLPRPYFEMWRLFPPPPSLVNQNLINLITNKPIVTKWFVFSEAKLNSLRSDLHSYTNNDLIISNYKYSPPSLVTILSAFIWSRVKIACYRNTNDIPHNVFQLLSMHSILSPPLEKSYYFGNTTINVIANLTKSLNDDDEWSLMGDFLEQMEGSVAKTTNDEIKREMQQGKVDLRYMTEYFEKERKGDIISVGFSNIRSLPLYEPDFGWGKPVSVTLATLMYNNLVTFIPANASTKDIVAYISLTHGDMAKLESDTKFNSLLYNTIHVKSKI